MVVTDDEALARRARHLSTQARLPGLAYDHDEVGYNYRLTNLAAAVGVAQLEEFDRLLGARRAIAARYDATIATIHGLVPAPRAPWADPTFWLYTAALETPDAGRRDRIITGLAEADIEARPIWRPIHQTLKYADTARLEGPVADRIFDAAFCLPSSSSLTQVEQGRVTDALATIMAAEGR